MSSDSDSSEDDPSDYAILHTFVDFLLSIESATLQIKSSRDRPLKIYGDIHIDGGLYGKALTIYHRTSDDPETLSPETHNNLTLCGPRYALYARSPDFLYVDLYNEEDGSNLVHERVAYDGAKVLLNEPFHLSSPEDGENCVLTVHMTAFNSSVVTRTKLELLGSGSDTWLVSGTVSAVQTVLVERGEVTRNVPLFGRPESDPVRLDGPARAVPLDRNVAVTPIHIEDELVKRAYDLTMDAGVKPQYELTDPIHGKGSSLVINVHLMAKSSSHGASVLLKGAPKFELKGSHMLGRTYDHDGHIAGAPKRSGHAKSAVAEKHLCTGTSSVGDPPRVEEIESFTIDEEASHGLAIKVSVTHFSNYSCGNLDDEVFVEKLSLYQPYVGGEQDED